MLFLEAGPELELRVRCWNERCSTLHPLTYREFLGDGITLGHPLVEDLRLKVDDLKRGAYANRCRRNRR